MPKAVLLSIKPKYCELKIYDEPRELSEFTGLRETKFGAEPVTIKRPPQSWCYVEAVEKND